MRKLLAVGVAMMLMASAAPAAAQTYVGSWRVDDGPSWTTVPVAYTAREAAAFLFGGVPTDYAISTVDDQAANINNLGWYSVWGGCGGFPCGQELPEDAFQNTNGFYQNPGDISAYVDDWSVGPQFTNYAFRVATVVPEPGTYALMLVGLSGLGVVARRRRNA